MSLEPQIPAKSGEIFEKISKIMLEVQPIKKDRESKTTQGKVMYKFRGIDDVYEALQAIMAKHGVFTVPWVLEDRTEDRKSNSGNVLIYRILTMIYTFYAGDGSFFSARVIGEGMDSGDKASNKAMSVAHKYALLQVFAIPTDDHKDPENDNHNLERKSGGRPLPAGLTKKAMSPQDVTKAIVKTFAQVGVSRVILEKYLNNSLDKIDATQVGLLRKLAKEIKDGSMSVELAFGGSAPVPNEEPPEASAIDDLNEQFS